MLLLEVISGEGLQTNAQGPQDLGESGELGEHGSRVLEGMQWRRGKFEDKVSSFL